MVLAKGFEALDFSENGTKKINIMWDKDLQASKYSKHIEQNGGSAYRRSSRRLKKFNWAKRYTKLGKNQIMMPKFQRQSLSPSDRDNQTQLKFKFQHVKRVRKEQKYSKTPRRSDDSRFNKMKTNYDGKPIPEGW